MASLYKQLVATEDVRICTYELDPLERGERHYHTSVAEYLVSLSGTLEVHIDGRKDAEILKPGMMCEIASGTIHQIINTETFPAYYLLIQGVGNYDFNVISQAYRNADTIKGSEMS